MATKQEQHTTEGEGVEVGGDIVPEAGCSTEVRLSRSAARMSTMLLQMMEGGCAEGGVPIEGANAGILRLVATYCKKHGPHYDPDTLWTPRRGSATRCCPSHRLHGKRETREKEISVVVGLGVLCMAPLLRWEKVWEMGYTRERDLLAASY